MPIAASPTKISSNAGACKSLITGFSTAVAVRMMLCDATPDITVMVVVNVPAVSGMNTISTSPLVCALMAKASSPSRVASAEVAFSSV